MSIIFNKKNIIFITLLIVTSSLLFLTINYFNDKSKHDIFFRGLLEQKEESNKIILKYKIDNLSNVPVLLFNSYLLPFISSMILNKINIKIVNKYEFETIGVHEIVIYFQKN